MAPCIALKSLSIIPGPMPGMPHNPCCMSSPCCMFETDCRSMAISAFLLRVRGCASFAPFLQDARVGHSTVFICDSHVHVDASSGQLMKSVRMRQNWLGSNHPGTRNTGENSRSARRPFSAHGFFSGLCGGGRITGALRGRSAPVPVLSKPESQSQ